MTQNNAERQKTNGSQKKLLIFTATLGILLLYATYIFGVKVLAIAAVSYAASIVVELAFAHFRKRPLDKGWMVTPMLVALLVPVSVPIWLPVIAAAFGTFFGKSIFGGTGQYVFNPALVGILFVIVAFPAPMNTQWLNPITGIIETQTPLIRLNFTQSIGDNTFIELLLGNTAGLIGETFRAGIILLGLFLIAMKVIDWRVPVSILVSFFAITGIGFLISPDNFRDPVLSLFVGALLFSAFFVAPDPATTPSNHKGKYIYGFGIAVITIVIRNFGTFPEGILFAIIIMNAVTPLIDNHYNKAIKEEEAAA
ncbi:MAG: RnfABCDGE type electron transport complex subunit D [Candidatus Izemoplasmataceae bacterium]|jgi:RnfABCDGE-type electron transport complex D subunit